MSDSGAESRGLAHEVLSRLIALTGPRPSVVLAFSGGMDSTVLAHLLVSQRARLGGLRLVHVDHGLQRVSAQWSRRCAAQARVWKVSFRSLRASIELRPGESPEARAREARYALLAREIRAGEVLVTAQHRDDQAETLLLQLFRGAGVAGLAAMPASADFGAGRLVRPLLEQPRSRLEQYARRHQLRWIEDPTNQQDQFDRNYLRLRVMPWLRQRWKGVDACLARSARHLAEASALIDAQARRDVLDAADGAGLQVAALRRLPPARRHQALRLFIADAGLALPSTAQLREMAGPLLSSRNDAQPQVRWSGGVLRRRSGRLLLDATPIAASPNNETIAKSWRWKNDRELHLSDGTRLVLQEDPAGPIDLDKLPASLDVRARRGGEQLRPAPRARTQSLKKLLQAAKLSVEERARLPLLFAAGSERLVAVADRWLDASIMANVKSRRRARLQHAPSRK